MSEPYLSVGAVDEAITEDVIIDTSVATDCVWRGAGESFHSVIGKRALWKGKEEKVVIPCSQR